jgi:hypothetical protein
MGCLTMMIDDEDDDRQYAALEAEMAEPVEDGSDLWDGGSRSDDDGDDGGQGGDPQEARERDGGENDDADAIERASLEADELEYRAQEQERYSQQQRMPDLYEDPVRHLESLGQELQAMRSQREYQQFLGTVEQHENDFKVLQPDYHEAVTVLEKSRRDELAQMFPDRSAQAHLIARRQGFRDPKALREAIFIQDAQTVAANALRSGINPAKAYYDLAAQRGYKPKPGRAAPSRGGKSGGRSGGGKSGIQFGSMNVAQLAEIYAEDAEEFDRQWDKAAKAGALG